MNGRSRISDTRYDTVTGHDFTRQSPLNRADAIYVKCIECMGGSTAWVQKCEVSCCPLWPWRTPERAEEN